MTDRAKLKRSVVDETHTISARFAAVDTADGTLYLRVDGRYEFSGGNTQESYGVAVLVDENDQPVKAETMTLLIRYADGYEAESPVLQDTAIVQYGDMRGTDHPISFDVLAQAENPDIQNAVRIDAN